jgi:cytochrome oxidase Cu insertion factor (SCO1/SenC/PrrC family)
MALKEYLAQFHSGATGLTGSPEALRSVYHAYQVYPGHAGGDSVSGDHSGLVYLLDAAGHTRAQFTAQLSAAAMARLIAGKIGTAISLQEKVT